RPIDPSQHRPSITQTQREASQKIGPHGHSIGNSKKFPERMSTDVVVSLSVVEQGGKGTAGRGSQMPVVKEGLLPQGLDLPAHHACGCNRDPIYSSSLVRFEPANLLKAAFPKQLAAAGNMIVPFETMTVGAVAFLDEDGPRDSEVLVFRELSKKELQIICLKGNIRIEIAYNLIPQSSDPSVPAAARLHSA